jgi:membrane protease subunit HflC
MRRYLGTIFGLIILGVVIILSVCFYIVNETEQVVITQFGEPIGVPITRAGLHFKTPIQTVNRFEKRILQWNGDAEETPTLDKRLIWVDTFARWKIVDALRFMQTVGTESAAQARLDDIIDSATRDAISSEVLVEVIRNSNDLIQRIADEVKSKELQWELSEAALESIKSGREALTRRILENSAEDIRNFGIELIDVRIKRINYVQKVQEKVYERMISERKRAAEQFRSEGQGAKAEIEGQMEKELKQIRSEAYRKAQEIKGKADAEAIKIYADAYNKDPEFFSFVKTLDVYKDTIDGNTTLILSTDNDFYEYIKNSNPKGVSFPE